MADRDSLFSPVRRDRVRLAGRLAVGDSHPLHESPSYDRFSDLHTFFFFFFFLSFVRFWGYLQCGVALTPLVSLSTPGRTARYNVRPGSVAMTPTRDLPNLTILTDDASGAVDGVYRFSIFEDEDEAAAANATENDPLLGNGSDVPPPLPPPPSLSKAEAEENTESSSFFSVFSSKIKRLVGGSSNPATAAAMTPAPLETAEYFLDLLRAEGMRLSTVHRLLDRITRAEADWVDTFVTCDGVGAVADVLSVADISEGPEVRQTSRGPCCKCEGVAIVS